MIEPQTHPTHEELAAYSLGQLPQQQSEAVENHVTRCTPCAETLVELSAEDTFLGLLREADEDPNVDTIDLDKVDPDDDRSSAKLPPPLRDHPRFEVKCLIGHGGMGEVFKAKHRLMERTVALKVIHRKFVRSEEAVERFRREVRAAAHLIHPNIVTAYDAEQADDTHLLAMEFVDGIELSEIVRKQGPLPVKMACDYAQQVARGLQHAYEMGMVHRDIKPQNLMVTDDGVVKILDFGLACIAHDALEVEAAVSEQQAESSQASDRLTTHGTVMGTPDYLAPEQAGDAHAADIRADVYSLGCTLYFMLSGRPPFAGGSVTQKLDAHKYQMAPPLADTVPNVPPELSDIIVRMMAKDPEERFETPQQVVEALAPFAADETPLASAAPPRHRPPLVATLIGFAGFAAIIAAMGVWRIQTPLGTVEVRADEAIADDVQVVLSNRGEKVSVLKPGDFAVDLEEGVYQVSLDSPDTRAQLRQKRISIKRGETTIVEVTLSDRQEPIERNGEPLIATLQGHDAEVSDLAYAVEKKLLASSSFDGTINLWNSKTGSLIDTLRGHEGKVHSVSITSDETTLASSGEDGTIRLWNLADRGDGRIFQQGLPSWSDVRFSPDGRTLASDGKDNKSVAVWDVQTGKKLHDFSLGDREPETFEFSPDGVFLAVSSHRWLDEGSSSKTEGGYLSLWNTATGQRVWSVVGDPRTIPSLGFSPDGLLLATGQANHRTYVRSVATGKQMWEVSGHPSWVWSAKFSPNGQLLASACQQISMWDVHKQRDVAKLPGHYSDQVSLVFLDPQTLASAGYDRDIKLWDLEAAISTTAYEANQGEREGEQNSQVGADQLQGNWRFISVQEPGRQTAINEGHPRVEITSDSIIFRADDEDLAFTRLAYSVNPNTDPGQIDIEGEFVRGRHVVRLGIYEVEENLLRIALANPGEEHPESFHGHDADIFTFQRRREISGKYSDDVITFEAIPGNRFPSDGMEVSTQFLPTHGVRFYLEGGGFPRIAEVGAPATAFSGPPQDLGKDNPVDVDRVGSYFLTDDRSVGGGTSRALIIKYRSPTYAAKGDVLDLDFDEKLVIQPRDASGDVLDTIVVAAGDPHTGDGVATPWAFERADSDVHSVRLQVTRREPGGLGFGFDNLVLNSGQSRPR